VKLEEKIGTIVLHTGRAEQQLGRLRNDLDYTNIEEILQQGLHEFIDRFQRQLNVVGDAIFETFFAV